MANSPNQRPEPIVIGKRRVGPGEPCFIVAEMSGNHGHDFDRAIEIVRAAAAAGADAIKMQAYTADTITLAHDGDDFLIAGDSQWVSYGTLHELYQQAYTPWEWFAPLTAEANKLGMEAFCSVFDDTSVDFMETIGTCAYKVAAPEITDIPLLRKIASTGKPVILSSGVASEADLVLACETLRENGCNDIIVLKCTSEYPAPVNKANLRTMEHFVDTLGCISGLSDHTTELAVPIAAVCLGADVIEKHFTLDSVETVDSFFSLNPGELKQMVEQIRIAEQALGTVAHATEDSTSWSVRRSLYVSNDIRKGERFTPDNVKSVRPGHGLHPRHWDELMRACASHDMGKGDRLTLEDLGSAAASKISSN